MSTMYKNSVKYAKTLILWVFFACLVGVLGGIIGSLFHHSIDFVTELRENHRIFLYLLPLGGTIIAVIYNHFNPKGRLDTNRVIDGAKGKKDIPIIMLPLIFVSSVITHLVGGSAGREGAALQLGGSLGYNTGKVFKLKGKDIDVITMAGMSAVFSALFGTPVAAAVFAVEVAYINKYSLCALIPCFISSMSGYYVSLRLGIMPVRFELLNYTGYNLVFFARSIFVAIICAFVSILFCFGLRKSEEMAKIMFKNVYFRGFCGGIIILALTHFLGSSDYNGAGMNIIERAINGEAKYEAFILKIIFTSITVASGFKGGEIVPAFFVGSTLGCVLASLLGLDPGLGAAIGFVALFCGVTKSPFTSFFLAFEVFYGEWIIMFLITCIISYLLSGKIGIYESKNGINYKKISQ